MDTFQARRPALFPSHRMISNGPRCKGFASPAGQQHALDRCGPFCRPFPLWGNGSSWRRHKSPPFTCASRPFDRSVYISYRLAMKRHDQRGVSAAIRYGIPVQKHGIPVQKHGIPVQKYGMPVQKTWDTGAKTWDAGAVTQTKGGGRRCLEKS